MARRSDLIIARVFYSDSAESKMRPCIVLSGERYNSTGYVMVAPMTTAGDEYCLPIVESDADCRIAPGSGIRADIIMRLQHSQIIKKIGRAKDEFYWELVGKIRELIE